MQQQLNSTRAVRSRGTKAAEVSSSIVAVIGGINMDLVFETERIPDPGESLDAASITYLPGGKGANTAVAVHRASHTKPVRDDGKSDSNVNAELRGEETDDVVSGHDILVFMNGAVGNDQFGRELKAKLKSQNIDISGIQTVEGNSGTCSVIVETLNRESRNLGYQAANLKWKASDPDAVECLAAGFKPDLIITHLGIPRERIEKVLRIAKKAGIDTVLNPSPATLLVSATYKNVTHLILNEQEAAHLSGRNYAELLTPAAWKLVAQEFIKMGVGNVIITLAEKGAYYATSSGKEGKIDAVPNVVVKDATGAG